MDKCLKLFAAVIISTTFWNLPAFAASFDCSKATTETEIAICNDDELGVLDERMSNAYMRARVSQDGEQHKNEQLKWLKERDLCFGDKQCLENAYNSILTKLSIFDYEALFLAALRNRAQCYQAAEEGLSSGFTHKMMGPSKELNTCIQNIVKHLIIATTSADANTIEKEFESLRGSHKFLTYHTFNTRKECSPSCGTMFELFPSAYYRDVIENVMRSIFEANEMQHLWQERDRLRQ